MPPPIPLTAAVALHTHAPSYATLASAFAALPAPSSSSSSSASDHPTSPFRQAETASDPAFVKPDLFDRAGDDPPLVWDIGAGADVAVVLASEAPSPQQASPPASAIPLPTPAQAVVDPAATTAGLLTSIIVLAHRTSLPAASPTPAPTAAALVRRGGDGDEEDDCGCEETTTKVVTITASSDVPDCITVTQTYGVTKTSGTTTQTIYYGTATITPSYKTITVYPTTTEQKTKTTTVHTTTKTKTSPTATKTGVHRACLPGDADEKEFTGLKPTHDQSITLYVIAIYLVGIGLGWNLVGLRFILHPFKLLTVAIHESGHLFGCIVLSTGIGEYTFSPIAGGITYVKLDDTRTRELMPPAALPLGFVMSIFIGGLLTFCGFDTLASKIASFIVGLMWLALIISSGFSLDSFLCLCAAGLMIGLWWADSAWGLRWYILFLGVMNSFYVLWDAADDAFFAKLHPCCCVLHFVTLELWSPALWTLFYFLISFVIFVGFILAALACWKQSPHAMYCQAQTFLPT